MAFWKAELESRANTNWYTQSVQELELAITENSAGNLKG